MSITSSQIHIQSVVTASQVRLIEYLASEYKFDAEAAKMLIASQKKVSSRKPAMTSDEKEAKKVETKRLREEKAAAAKEQKRIEREEAKAAKAAAALAEKEAARAHKEEEKKALIAAKQADKDAAKAAKQAEKDAAKAAKQAEKDAAKAAKQAEKASPKKRGRKAVAPKWYTDLSCDTPWDELTPSQRAKAKRDQKKADKNSTQDLIDEGDDMVKQIIQA